jgi:hypothetical protein
LKDNGLIFDYLKTNLVETERFVETSNRKFVSAHNIVEFDFMENTFKDKANFNNYSYESNKDFIYSNDSKKCESSGEQEGEDDDFDRKLRQAVVGFSKGVQLKKVANGIYDYNGHKLRLSLENSEFKGNTLFFD